MPFSNPCIAYLVYRVSHGKRGSVETESQPWRLRHCGYHGTVDLNRNASLQSPSKMLSLLVALVSSQTTVTQTTPDQANWAAMNTLVLSKVPGHTPQNTTWIYDWPKWNQQVTNITQMTGAQVQATICYGGTGIVFGLKEVYEEKPFTNHQNPPREEVDDYHLRIIRHVRKMVGITTPVSGDRCLANVAYWSQQLVSSTYWDSKYPTQKTKCLNNYGYHCNFAPATLLEQQQSATQKGIKSTVLCKAGPFAESIATTNADIPWSVKFSKILCQFMKDSHGGPILARQYVHTNFWQNGAKVSGRLKGSGTLTQNPLTFPFKAYGSAA